MNHVGIFIAGTLVTLVVTTALALLVWGAILDGRDEAERRELERQRERAVSPTPLTPLEGTTGRVPPRAA
jgi:hypothetical protein